MCKLKYVKLGLVKLLISVFDVPKVNDDICLVYNGTLCKLNKVLVAQCFSVPIMFSMLRELEAGTCLGDTGIDDMFYNFMLSFLLCPYIGVDFKQFPKLNNESNVVYDAHWDKIIEKKGSKEIVGEMWSRMCMDFAPSQNCVVQGIHVT